MSRPRIALNLPGAEVENPARLADHARQAEQLGFESVWSPDLVNVEGAPALEPLTALAVAAGATDRIGLGVGVLALAARPLALIATQIASLQLLSGGRLLLGVGLGGPPTDSLWSACGKSEQQRGRQFDTAAESLGRLLAGETADLPDSRRREPARLAPVPPAAPGLLVGGQGPASMRRAVTLGADWLPSLSAPRVSLPRSTRFATRPLARADRCRASPSVCASQIPPTSMPSLRFATKLSTSMASRLMS